MSFLQPIALFGILLAAAPLIIHLLNLLRHRRESWAAMRFLVEAKERSSRMSKIRRWLTLLVRMLIIALLVILLARPISSGNQSLLDLAAKEPEVLMLILDRSSSMRKKSENSSKTLLQHGLEEFDRFPKSWPESKLVVMETLWAEPLFLDTVDTLYTEEMEEIVGPTDSGAILPETINRALVWLDEADVAQAEILIVSDFQRPSWQVNQNSEMLQSINETINEKQGLWKLKFLQMKPGKSFNYSLTCKSYSEETDSFFPTLQILGNKKGQEKLALKIRINGIQFPMESEFTYPSTTWTPTIPLAGQPRTGWISISLPEDSFPEDNEYFFTYGNQSMLKVGISCEDPQAKKCIIAACSLNPEKVFLTENLFTNRQEELIKHELLVIQGEVPQESQGWVDQFLFDGGVVIFFPSEESKNKIFTFQKWGDYKILSEDDFCSVREWIRNEGVFANTANGKELPLSHLKIQKRIIPLEGQPLAFYTDGNNFLTRKIHGRGVLYSFSTLPNKAWSSLDEGFVLVPALQRIIEECERKTNFQIMECGDNHSRKLQSVLAITGEKRDKPAINAGIYQHLGNLVAVNRPADESTYDQLENNQLRQLISSEYASWSDAQSANSSFQRAEIWNFFLVCMILFLLFEGALSLPPKSFNRRVPFQ